MKNAHILVLTIILFTLNTSAQTDERNANYHYKSKSYYVAVNLYEKLHSQDTNNPEFMYRYADCLVNCKQKPKKAIELLLKIDSLYADDPFYTFILGQAYHYNMNFKKAELLFDKTIQQAKKEEVLAKNAKLWKAYAQSAPRLVKNPLDISFINMGEGLNSEMKETTPFISNDHEMLFYTSNQKYDRKYMIYSSNVYYATKKNGQFTKGKALSAVNSLDDEFMAGISLQNNNLYVQLQGFEGFQDLIFSESNGNSYRGKTLLNQHVNSKSAEIAAFETVNGDTLFFSSDRPEGFGGMDLYFSRKLPDGTWSVAQNMGDKINSAYDEDFPVLSSDNKTFYFCSNRPSSMGGFDIYTSSINSNTREFSEPKNIGYPLNDPFDNKTIAFDAENRYAYVSAIRDDSYGHTDIYRVVFNQEDPLVKLYLLKFKTGSAEAGEDFAATDTTLKITALNKNKTVFGEYAYDAQNSQATIAFPPGFYSIEIKGKNTEAYSFKVTIPDAPSEDKVVKQTVFLKPLNKEN